MYIRDFPRFKELMDLKGVSQQSLARKAHVSQAFISLIAHGRRGVRPETAWRIAKALDVFTEELFVDRSPPHFQRQNHLRRFTPAHRDRKAPY
ncbi:helix-turn-helix domain-containing protein [Streptomyces sp. NPDC001635]|nr:XRE family transcriptional regulator [Streptomyces sp. T1317-0309]